MNRYKKWGLVGLLGLLGVAFFVGSYPKKCGHGACLTVSENPPLYSVRGTYSVGYRTLEGGEDSSLALKLWYPASAEAGVEQALTYPYQVKIGAPLGNVTIATTNGEAITDAAFDRAKAPYPLVILSPGFAMGATSYSWLAEHLASYGFVVVAPEHEETLDPQNELWRSAVQRPNDVLTVFEAVDGLVVAGGLLDGVVDVEETAVIGHSYGGYTALAAAGAQIDTNSFTTHCQTAIQQEDPASWLCEMLLPNLANMSALAGFETTPAGVWPSKVDPRVKAIVPMAGDAYFFGKAGLAAIDVPVLAIGGTHDDDTPFDWGAQPTFDYVSSSKKALLAINGAEHMIFSNPCAPVRWYAKPLAGEFCSDSTLNRYQTHELVRHFVTAFLLMELQGETAVSPALDPNLVHFPTVSYIAEGY